MSEPAAKHNDGEIARLNELAEKATPVYTVHYLDYVPVEPDSKGNFLAKVALVTAIILSAFIGLAIIAAIIYMGVPTLTVLGGMAVIFGLAFGMDLLRKFR